MSDDRFSPEQREIEEAAAQAAPRCPAWDSRDGVVCYCELGRDHVGNHRAQLAGGGYRYWWDIVPVAEIERVMQAFEPGTAKPLPPGSVTAKPGKDEG